ncbi:MAG: hypothetical protein ACRDY2_08260 [Acidimicrobiales bacterium]
MGRGRIERRVFELSARLAKAREDLVLLDEQLEVFDAHAEDAKVRSLVSDSPQLYSEAKRHADAMRKARVMLCESIDEMERQQEKLISRLSASL